MKNNDVEPLSHTIYTKFDWKLIIYLNIRGIKLKVLEENIEGNLYDLGFGSGFLNNDTKSTDNKRKNI